MFNVVCIYKLIINTCIENQKYVSYSFGLSLNSHLLWIKLFKSLKDCIKLKIFASEDCFLLHTVDQYILLKKVKQCHIKWIIEIPTKWTIEIPTKLCKDIIVMGGMNTGKKLEAQLV